jgi:hypothetical protein
MLSRTSEDLAYIYSCQSQSIGLRFGGGARSEKMNGAGDEKDNGLPVAEEGRGQEDEENRKQRENAGGDADHGAVVPAGHEHPWRVLAGRQRRPRRR